SFELSERAGRAWLSGRSDEKGGGLRLASNLRKGGPLGRPLRSLPRSSRSRRSPRSSRLREEELGLAPKRDEPAAPSRGERGVNGLRGPLKDGLPGRSPRSAKVRRGRSLSLLRSPEGRALNSRRGGRESLSRLKEGLPAKPSRLRPK